MQLRYHILDVFTDQAFSGNPLAVVMDADGLNQGQMQKIAREFNLSETVFVQSPQSETALVRARIFTPGREVPFAGHPTVGTACLLSELGIAAPGEDQRFVLDEGIGPVPVRVRRAEGRPPYAELTTAQLPEYGPDAPDDATLAQMLGIEVDDIGSEGERPRTVSCGLPFLLVPLRAPEVLAGIVVDQGLWRSVLAGHWAQELYVYARGYEGELRTRMFAPAMGILEDPATGSAAAALGGALASESPIVEGRLQWVVHQGLEMGRPSQLHVSAERAGSAVLCVRVGGYAVRVAEGMLSTP